MSSSVKGRKRSVGALAVMALVAGVVSVVLPTAAHSTPAKAPAKAKATPFVASSKMWTALTHKAAARSTRAAAASNHKLQIHAPHGRLFSLKNSSMTSALTKSPAEFTAAAFHAPLILSIPDPVKGFQRFKVENAPIMMPKLAREHPEIQTYSGVGLTDKTATIRIAMTPLGFSASIRGSLGSWYVDTLYHLDRSVYVSYYAKDLKDTHGSNFVEREAHAAASAKIAKKSKVNVGAANANLASGGTLKIYRLALVSDPTFAAYWGPSNVTSGKVILMTRADQVYEEEFGYRMDLVGNNDLLNLNTPALAYEPNGPCGTSACYTQAQLASCGSSTLSRNRLVVGQLIGANNYDIGHISVGQDGGGIAALGVVGGNNKGEGCTGIPQPDGDYYVVDYLTHEMGHEFGMNHPFNGTQYNCSSSNRNANTSYEPGSGSSIMAYAGICRQDDLQPHSDPYFSAISYQETMAYTSSVLNNLSEVQTGVLTHFGGGNETQTATFGPGYQSVSSVDHGPLTVNIANPSTSSGTFPGAAEVGHTVTINTTTAHFLHVGDTVTISGVPVSGYNGTWTVTAVPFSTAFQFTDPTDTNLATTGGGTVTPPSFGATESGTTATITTTTPHNLAVGSTVTVAGMTATGYNGTFAVTAVPSATTFQYTATTAGLADSGNGTVTYNAPFQLGYNATDSPTIGGTGLSYTSANVQYAITGNEVQTVSLSGYNTNGFSYQLQYGSNLSAPIVRGTNNNAAGIAAAIQGITGWPAGLTVSIGTVSDSGYTVTFNAAGGQSPLSVVGAGSVTGSVAQTLPGNAGILPAGGYATVAGAAATGFTVTFGGSLANTDVPNLTIDNLSCGGCFSAMDETNHGGTGDSYQLTYGGGSPSATITNTSTTANVVTALQGVNEVQTVSLSNYNTAGASYTLSYNGQQSAPIVRGTNNTTSGIAAAIAGIPGWIAGSTVTIGSLTDAGYTVTFNGLGDVNPLSVNGADPVTGSVVETTKGTSGILPSGATATVAAAGFGSSVNSGIQVTFGGVLSASVGAGSAGSLAFTNLTGSASGSFSETEKGGPPTGNGGNVQQSTGNSPPTADVPAGPFTIPDQTPFALTGSSSDADGDTVSYMWEQFDKGLPGNSGGTALITQPKTNGPLFREFGTALNSGVYNVHSYGSACTPSGGTNDNGENCAGTDPTRVFPDMTQILADNTDAATGTCPETVPSAPLPLPQSLVDCLSEDLPTSAYAGPMHFILTTRDGHPGAGGVTESGLVTVNLAAGSGPFRVTSQSAPVTYRGGSTQTVTWNVAGTDQAPVSTANVQILLSTDGGNTFPTVLAASTPNDGSATVTIPNVGTSSARIEVAPADGNIYFDVSHSNFTIQGNQTITFPKMPAVRYGSADVDPGATASSGLPVSYLVDSGPCTVVSNKIHVEHAGSCKIIAYQHGDAEWRPALDVSRKLTISKARTTTTVVTDDVVVFGGTMDLVANVSGAGGPVDTGSVKFYTAKNTLAGQSSVSNGSAELDVPAPDRPTNLKVHAVYVPATNGNWAASTSKNVVVHVV